MKMTRHFQFSSHVGEYGVPLSIFILCVSRFVIIIFSLFHFCFFSFSVFFFVLRVSIFFLLLFFVYLCTIAFWAVQVSFNIVVIGIYSSAYAIHSHWPYTEVWCSDIVYLLILPLCLVYGSCFLSLLIVGGCCCCCCLIHSILCSPNAKAPPNSDYGHCFEDNIFWWVFDVFIPSTFSPQNNDIPWTMHQIEIDAATKLYV